MPVCRRLGRSCLSAKSDSVETIPAATDFHHARCLACGNIDHSGSGTAFGAIGLPRSIFYRDTGIPDRQPSRRSVRRMARGSRIARGCGVYTVHFRVDLGTQRSDDFPSQHPAHCRGFSALRRLPGMGTVIDLAANVSRHGLDLRLGDTFI